MEIIRQLDEQLWREFVSNHPLGNIFHTPEMFQVFSQVKGFKPMLWAALGADGQIEALFLPVYVTLNNLFGPLTRRAISYGSVLCSPTNEGRQALSMLLKTYAHENSRKCLFTELRNISNMEDEQPVLLELGFNYQKYLNYLIDLNRSPEEVFLSIGSRTRKNIKRGLTKGDVTIREVRDANEIGICYHLLHKTYRLAKVPLADRSLFDVAFKFLGPKKMIRFTLAEIEGIPAAVSVELLYKDVLYGWYGGMDRAFSRHNPNELLMWHLLKWGSENNFSQYDFGGAGTPDKKYGVRDFKAKFGGEMVCYGRNIWISRPIMYTLSKSIYSAARRIIY
jgi:hypothetical protein